MKPKQKSMERREEEVRREMKKEKESKKESRSSTKERKGEKEEEEEEVQKMDGHAEREEETAGKQKAQNERPKQTKSQVDETVSVVWPDHWSCCYCCCSFHLLPSYHHSYPHSSDHCCRRLHMNSPSWWNWRRKV